jgi:hypothetical protein
MPRDYRKAARARWEKPGAHEKQGEDIAASWRNPATRAARLETQRATFATEEFKVRKSEAMKRAAETRRRNREARDGLR